MQFLLTAVLLLIGMLFVLVGWAILVGESRRIGSVIVLMGFGFFAFSLGTYDSFMTNGSMNSTVGADAFVPGPAFESVEALGSPADHGGQGENNLQKQPTDSPPQLVNEARTTRASGYLCASCGGTTSDPVRVGGERVCGSCYTSIVEDARSIQRQLDSRTMTTCHFCGSPAPSGRGMCSSCLRDYGNALLGGG